MKSSLTLFSNFAYARRCTISSKCYDLYQGHFKKPVLNYKKTTKRIVLKGLIYFSRAVQVLAIFDA